MSQISKLTIGLAAVAILGSLAAESSGRRSPVSGAAPDRIELVRDHTDLGPDEPGLSIELDVRELRRMAAGGRVTIERFPLPGRVPVDLDVAPFDLLAPDALVVSADGPSEMRRSRPSLKAFRGTVVGDPDSSVTLTVFGNRIAGSIALWDEEFIFGPRDYDLSRPGATEIVVRSSADDPDPPGPGCDHDQTPEQEPASGNSYYDESSTDPWVPEVAHSSTVTGSTLLKASIAIDATYDWYQKFGSVEAAENYILNLMAQVSTIYENEVLVQLEVSYLRVHTSPGGPYTDGETSTSALLAELRSEWNSNQTGIDRTVAHLFSTRSSGGAGVAYVDVLCNHSAQPGNSYDYGVSTLSANGGSWEKDLVAHELGHNFSSPHTHCYAPEIDQCANQSGCYQGEVVQTVGTIMSYCNHSVSSFHPRVKQEQIRPAAEAAFPSCITTAGLPGSVSPGSGAGLTVEPPQQCATEALANDDGGLNQNFGYSGTAQMAWIKRFTPGCHPFLLDRIDVMFAHSSTVFAGRPVRLLVYTDPSGSGDPSNATLVHAEDTTVQSVSGSSFNQFTLSAPVALQSGDYYVGIYDLLADSDTTYIATVDSSRSGDSFRTANTTSPSEFSAHSGGTWMIRASGGAIGSDGLFLSWDPPCNDADTPGQDFSVYRGDLGDFTSFTSLTCTTGRETSHLAQGVSANSFVLVVPSTTASEGSYGRSSAGVERRPAALPCKPQEIAVCP